MASPRARLILRWDSSMGHEIMRGALCLTPPPRYAELKELELIGNKRWSRARCEPLLAQWGVPWPPPLGWRDTLILRALRRYNMVARRGEGT